MRYLNIIESLIDDDAEKFASSYNCPHINQWIIDNFKKGFNSSRDYSKIVKWVKETNPPISQFDFTTALEKADNYIKSGMKDNFDKYAELNSNSVVIDFDDGQKWIEVQNDDLNNAINKLQFDCHNDLMSVRDGDGQCWALLDAQDNMICLFINDENGCKVIGQHGEYPKCDKEIKKLCIRKGIDLIPEAYSYAGLINAIKSKQLDFSKVSDKRSLMKRLKSDDIIECDLVNQCNHASIRQIMEIYNKLKHDCLLTYCMAYMMSHGFIKNKLYDYVESKCAENKNVRNLISSVNSHDSKSYISVMDDAVSEISRL